MASFTDDLTGKTADEDEKKNKKKRHRYINGVYVETDSPLYATIHDDHAAIASLERRHKHQKTKKASPEKYREWIDELGRYKR